MKFIHNIIAIFVVINLIAFSFSDKAWGITVHEEKELSHDFMKMVLRNYDLIQDPVIVNYVNDIGHKIVAVLPPQPFSYKFYILKQDVYNAFASPAGHIFINSGLLEAMENEEELAGILGHEITHVVCRHISQKIEQAKKISAVTLAGIAAGIFLGIGGAASAANAIGVGSMAAGQSLMLSYSRVDEMQADQLGLTFLTKAGYDGRGLLSMLKKIREKEWFGSKQIPTYLKTHPGVEQRMAYIDTWLAQNKPATIQINPYNFNRAHARLVANYDDLDTALKTFEALIQKHPDDPIAHYGYGLALMRNDDWKNAAEQIKTALMKKPFDPYILKILGQINFNEGRYKEALNILTGTVTLNSSDPEILYYLGKTRLKLGLFHDAVNTFKEIIEKKYDYPMVFYTLGEAYNKLGIMDEAYYNLGIYYKKKGDFKNAWFQMKRALNITKDMDKKKKIEKLLKEIKKEQKNNG